MLKRLAQSAHELDEWLHQNVGRAYVAILAWGLVASILASLKVLGHALSGGKSGITPALVLVFQSALLVNQLAQWHDLRERRRRRKEVAPTPPPKPGESHPAA
jgi:hypothetical protein